MTGSGRGGGRGWRRDPPQPRAAVQGGSSGAWSKMPAPPSAPPPPVGVEGGGRRGGEGLAESPDTEHPRGGARGRSHTPREPLFSPGLQPEVRTCGSLYRRRLGGK